MRLQRVGRRHDPKFRVVVTRSQTGPKSRKHVDVVGSYDAKNGVIKLEAEKITDWLSKGVQPSDTVHNMLVDNKIIEGKKVNALPKKTPIVKEAPEEEAPAAAEETAAPAEEAPVEAEATTEEAPAEEEAKEEAPAEEPTAEEEKEETPAEEEKAEEAPAEE